MDNKDFFFIFALNVILNLFMVKYFIFFIFFGLACMHSSYSQKSENIRFVHIGPNEGISQSTVVDITQDKYGNMWFATYNGLNKYDGYEITVYKHNDLDSCSIGENIVRTCHCDKSGNIWVGTANGLSFYDSDKDSFRNYRYSESACDVRGIADYDEDKLLLIIDKKLALFDCKEGSFLENELPAILSSIRPTSLEQRDDKIFIGSREGVFIYSTADKELKEIFIEELKEKNINALLQESVTRLWVATEGHGLFLVNPQSGSVIRYLHSSKGKSSIGSNYIRALAFDSEQQLWIGTTNSLSIYDAKNNIFHSCENKGRNEEGLSHNSVRSLFKDSQGGMWVGTYWGGVNYYHPLKKRFSELNVPGINVNNSVIGCIREDSHENLWIGTNEGGVFCYNPHTGKTVQYTKNKGLGSNDVKFIYPDDTEGLVYVGTHAGGLNIIHCNNGLVEQLESNGAFKNIYAIEPTGSGNFWLSSLYCLFYFNSSTKTLSRVNLNHEFLKSGITFIYRDSRRRLWIGGKKGVEVFRDDNEKITSYPLIPFDAPFRRKFVNCVYESHDGTFWIATRSGLYRFDEYKKETKLYTTEHGLPDNVIHGILEDEYGKLWFGTDKGMGSLLPETGSFRNYTDIDGLSSNQFTENSFCRSKSGRIYLGGINGITFFHPVQLVDNPYTPPVVITRLNLFNKVVEPGDSTGILKKSISTTKRITLTAGQKMFSLQFVVSNYISGVHNTFAYMLKGYDNEWYYTNTPSVSYSNLPHGTYRFMVKASNNDGKWNETPTELEIVVLPVWYKTWWAILLFIALICAVIAVILRYFWIKKMMRTQIMYERMDKERQKETNEMKLSFFINIAHELRTPLTLILAPLRELMGQVNDRKMYKQLMYIEKSTNRLLHLVNQLMDYRKAELGIFALHVSYNRIYGIVQKTFSLYERVAQEKNIRYHFNSEIVEEEYVFCDSEYIELILNNLLSNAFKYTEEGGSITVTLGKHGSEISLSIQDTGCGIPLDKQDKIFERFYQVNNCSMSSGIGLSVVKKLVDMHHGRIELNSKEGCGSTFSVFLPGDESAYSSEEISKEGMTENGGMSSGSILPLYVEKGTYEFEQEEEKVSDIGSEKKNILIVEDNPEILRYLTDELGILYNIWEARHGREALEVVNEQEIDMILTDIMMPVMDGLQLCSQIKQNVRTCHIPVVILSAKADLKEQLEGLHTGADDYISKPFVMAVIKAKIHNMFRTRYRVIQYYSKSLEVEPEKMSLSSMDEAFLKKAKEVVEEHLDDVEFSTEAFAREMCMSRSNLHLKIKALTGESSYDFIRKIRFNRACKLLLEGGYTVSEISNIVGFSVPSYFSTSFKKYFGCLPTEYARKKRNQQI